MPETRVLDIVREVRSRLATIGPPDYRTKVPTVRVGLSAADLSGAEWPMLAVFLDLDRDDMRPIGSRHESTLALTIFGAVRDKLDAHSRALALAEDVKDALKAAEFLPTPETLAAGERGLLYSPLRILAIEHALDVEDAGGVATFNASIEAKFRSAH